MDATALAEQVRKGEVTAIELAEQALAALERVEPTLNAVVHRLDAKARARAKEGLPDGPFSGVPFVVKDLDGFLKGAPYTMGSRFTKDFVPQHDAELLARLRGTGLNFVAKTACPELGILGTTEAELWGPTRNPWSPDHSTGGSSGGTAALVAAGVVPMGHAGDGGGSIRIPASACGLFGLKTTRARVPMAPDLGEGWGGYVQPGVISRSVRDSAGAYDAVCGPALGDPYFAPPKPMDFVQAVKEAPGPLRIAFSTRPIYADEAHPDCIAAVRDAAALLEELGHTVEEVHLPVEREPLAQAYLTQVAAAVAVELDDMARWTGKKLRASEFEPSTWFLAQLGHKLSAADLQHSRDLCHGATRTIEQFFTTHDLYLTSTMAQPPARIGEWALKTHEKVGLAALRAVPIKRVMHMLLADMAENGLGKTANTMIFNQSGHPAMSVPLFWSPSGLPIGVQFAGRFGDEATLFRLAAQLEQARPWADKRPQVSAQS